MIRAEPTVAKLDTVHLRTLTACTLLALLAACGGGGSDTPAAPAAAGAPVGAPSPAPAPGPAPAPAPTPPPAPPATATCGLPDFAASALVRVNQLRAAGADCRSGGSFAPVGALAWNALLTQAAAGHSLDMATLNYFAHTSADGRSLANRIDATGYAWSRLGENIGAGYGTVNLVIDGWMASDGHCANLMSPNFTELGLACVPGTAGSRYNTYWTMDLARPR